MREHILRAKLILASLRDQQGRIPDDTLRKIGDPITRANLPDLKPNDVILSFPVASPEKISLGWVKEINPGLTSNVVTIGNQINATSETDSLHVDDEHVIFRLIKVETLTELLNQIVQPVNLIAETIEFLKSKHWMATNGDEIIIRHIDLLPSRRSFYEKFKDLKGIASHFRSRVTHHSADFVISNFHVPSSKKLAYVDIATHGELEDPTRILEEFLTQTEMFGHTLGLEESEKEIIQQKIEDFRNRMAANMAQLMEVAVAFLQGRDGRVWPVYQSPHELKVEIQRLVPNRYKTTITLGSTVSEISVNVSNPVEMLTWFLRVLENYSKDRATRLEGEDHEEKHAHSVALVEAKIEEFKRQMHEFGFRSEMRTPSMGVSELRGTGEKDFTPIPPYPHTPTQADATIHRTEARTQVAVGPGARLEAVQYLPQPIKTIPDDFLKYPLMMLAEIHTPPL